MATIQPGYITLPFDWRIHVRCDDPKKLCSCGGGNKKPDLQAYTTNQDDDSGLPRINFCPLYFGLDNLDAAMKFGNDKEKAVEHWADMTNYVRNKGTKPCLPKHQSSF